MPVRARVPVLPLDTLWAVAEAARARAVAVREWMQRMGDLPDSCFAIQGFGKSQPIASNDTEAGRQANRRVEIRLLPEVGACALPTAAAGV